MEWICGRFCTVHSVGWRTKGQAGDTVALPYYLGTEPSEPLLTREVALGLGIGPGNQLTPLLNARHGASNPSTSILERNPYLFLVPNLHFTYRYRQSLCGI